VDHAESVAEQLALHQAFEMLPVRQRIALTLRYVHDLSDVEIAAALTCRRGTANSLLSRGRALLHDGGFPDHAGLTGRIQQ
jgi:RNA polymerase sigma-70 factor (ECF subfamily)